MGVQQKQNFLCALQNKMTLISNGPRTMLQLSIMSGARRQKFGLFLLMSAGSIMVSGNNITAQALVNDTILEVSDGKILLLHLGSFELIVINGLD